VVPLDLVFINEIEWIGGRNDLVSCVSSAFPEHVFFRFLFPHPLPPHFWRCLKNQRLCLEWFEGEHGILELTDWYGISPSQITASPAKQLFTKIYHSSLFLLLSTIYVDHEWEFWRMKKTSSYVWKRRTQQRRYLDFLFRTLRSPIPLQFYSLSKKQILDHCGKGFLSFAFSTSSDAIISLYPELRFLRWKFDPIPALFWKYLSTIQKFISWRVLETQKFVFANSYMSLLFQRELMDDISSQISHISALSHWEDYLLSQEISFQDERISTLFSHVYSTVPEVLVTLYPERKWNFKPIHFNWNASQARHYLTWIGEELKKPLLQDFYDIKEENLISHGGKGLFLQYNASLSSIINFTFPEVKWDTKQWNFYTFTPQRMIEQIARKKGITEFNLFHMLAPVDFLFFPRGNQLLRNYDGSLYSLFCSTYPNHNWCDFWRYSPSLTEWKSLTRQRRYFEWIARELKIVVPSHLPLINKQDVLKRNGDTLIFLYESQPLPIILETLFPEIPFQWQLSLPSGECIHHTSYKTIYRMKKITEIATKSNISIRQPHDWYRVSWNQLKEFHSLFSNTKVFVSTLEELYPNHKFNLEHFLTKFKKSSQRQLLLNLSKYGVDRDMIEGMYLRKNGIVSSSFELDIFVPHYSLAFEYQGMQHFTERVCMGGIEMWANRDDVKRVECLREGISLFQVPFWSEFKQVEMHISIDRPDLRELRK